MPEGDSIHKLAATLRPHLVGQRLESGRLREHGEVGRLAGATVSSVEAVGKHLLVALDFGWTLRVHLGLHGSVRRYPRSNRRPSTRAHAVLTTAQFDIVCTKVRQVEFFPTRFTKSHPALSRLGPDLVADTLDTEEIVKRARQRPNAELAEMLLDQTVAAGVGNVYRSEALFVSGLYPFLTVASVDDSTLAELYRWASTALRANVRSGPRRVISVETRPWRPVPGEPLLWVYRRQGEPCLKCGAKIQSRRHGKQSRVTYWCPRCQSPPLDHLARSGASLPRK